MGCIAKKNKTIKIEDEIRIEPFFVDPEIIDALGFRVLYPHTEEYRIYRDYIIAYTIINEIRYDVCILFDVVNPDFEDFDLIDLEPINPFA